MCFKKNKKGILLYIVSNSPVLSSISVANIFTITETKEQAQEYTNKKIVLDNKEHFDAWCELHNKDSKSKETWAFYAEQIMGYKGYHLLETKYLIKDIAQIFRTMNGCIPIGCSFDESIELIYMLMSKDNDILQSIEKILGKDNVNNTPID